MTLDGVGSLLGLVGAPFWLYAVGTLAVTQRDPGGAVDRSVAQVLAELLAAEERFVERRVAALSRADRAPGSKIRAIW
ncbi:hypothetical protein [Nocardioides plantarum]|uniref:Uncharacterized protein n=1 Tax=Nocardioides plantarum TaxID=29299 RepID=A0ABV5KDG0_9ACTN|nr:hypothetical protein [Nocardioides plantarum]